MLSRRMSVNVGAIKFTAKTFRDFLFPAFSHQIVHLNSIWLVRPWSQLSAFMNLAPTDLSCGQSLPFQGPTSPDTGLCKWCKCSMLTSKQAAPVDLMSKVLQGSEMALVGIKQTGVWDGMLLEAINWLQSLVFCCGTLLAVAGQDPTCGTVVRQSLHGWGC